MRATSTFRWDVLDRGVSGIVRPVGRAGLKSGIYGPRVLLNGQAQIESSVPVTRTFDDPWLKRRESLMEFLDMASTQKDKVARRLGAK